MRNIADALLHHKIDAVIATNTTLSRTVVQGMRHGEDAGGMASAPVFELSNTVIRLLKGELGEPCRSSTWVASSAARMHAIIEAGAQLVQLYTGFI